MNDEIRGAQPLVSVVVPAYNAEKYIEEAIRSVQSQTVGDWELIAVDDASGDRTKDILAALAAEDARIRVIGNEKNRGVAVSRNRGLDAARGQYVALLDADDVWLPDKLRVQIEKQRETGADIVYCSYAMVNEYGEKSHADFIVAEKTSLRRMLRRSELSCSTVLLTRPVAERYRFRTDFYHEDYALWLELLKAGNKAVGVPGVYACYRVQHNSRASDKLNSAMHRWRIYRELLSLSFLRSALAMTGYILCGLRKYSRRRDADT